jgi:hypothetical protein
VNISFVSNQSLVETNKVISGNKQSHQSWDFLDYKKKRQWDFLEYTSSRCGIVLGGTWLFFFLKVQYIWSINHIQRVFGLEVGDFFKKYNIFKYKSHVIIPLKTINIRFYSKQKKKHKEPLLQTDPNCTLKAIKTQPKKTQAYSPPNTLGHSSPLSHSYWVTF